MRCPPETPPETRMPRRTPRPQLRRQERQLVFFIFLVRLASYPQFIVKKFPFVLRDKTDWAIEAVPNATKTKVPAKRR